MGYTPCCWGMWAEWYVRYDFCELWWDTLWFWGIRYDVSGWPSGRGLSVFIQLWRENKFKLRQGYIRTWKRPALIPHRNSITLRPANFPNPPNRPPNRPNRGYCSRGVPIVLLLHPIVLYCFSVMTMSSRIIPDLPDYPGSSRIPHQMKGSRSCSLSLCYATLHLPARPGVDEGKATR
jgi:hypothetical protein